jgi:hypothetical protein
MDMQAKGYVTYAGSNLFGGKKLYSFRISSEDKFFGTGTTDHKLEKNDLIEFEYTVINGRCNVDPSGIERVAREESSAYSNKGQGAGAVQRSSGEVGRSGGYWDIRLERDKENDGYRKANDLRIQYQSARNAAISVVDVLLRERVLKLADGAKADNVAVVMGKLDDLTNEFFARCSKVAVPTDGGSRGGEPGVEEASKEWS